MSNARLPYRLEKGSESTLTGWMVACTCECVSLVPRVCVYVCQVLRVRVYVTGPQIANH